MLELIDVHMSPKPCFINISFKFFVQFCPRFKFSSYIVLRMAFIRSLFMRIKFLIVFLKPSMCSCFHPNSHRHPIFVTPKICLQSLIFSFSIGFISLKPCFTVCFFSSNFLEYI